MKINIFNKFNHKLILSIILIIIFIAIPPFFTYDSAIYKSYIPILKGDISWSQWNPTRGIGFPLLIYLSNLVFGDSIQGITIFMLLFYLTSFYIFVKLNLISEDDNIFYVISLLIFLNPIILGYYHVLLTEFITATVAIASIAVLKKYGTNVTIKILWFSIITILLWHLKQMYVTCSLIPLIGYELISILESDKGNIYKNILRSILVFITVFTSLIISLTVWGSFIKTEKLDEASTSSSFLRRQLIYGVSNFDIKETNDNIPNQPQKVTVISKEDNIIRKEFKFEFKGNSLDAPRYIMNCFIEDPINVTSGYIKNYLTILNMFYLEDDKGLANPIIIKEKFAFLKGAENSRIAGIPRYFINDGITSIQKTIGSDPKITSNLSEYYQTNDTNIFIKVIYSKAIRGASNVFYTLTLLINPLLLIYSIACIIKRKDRGIFSSKFTFIITLFGVVHIGLLAILNSVIDRYAFPVFVLSLSIVANIILSLINKIFKRNIYLMNNLNNNI